MPIAKLVKVASCDIREFLGGLMSTASNEALKSIQTVFMQFERRSEKVSQEILARTFVDAEPLFIQLSSKNHQVLYGRRGTGKTHALKFLAEQIESKNEIAIYVDLRTIGSNNSLYNDYNRSIAERATRLVTDVLEALEQELMAIAVRQLDSAPDANQLTLRLDDFAASIKTVEIKGVVEKEKTIAQERSDGSRATAALTQMAPSISLGSNVDKRSSSSERVREKGEESVSIDFGGLQTALSGLLDVLGVPRIWLLVDEWSEIPLELQPLLADLLRRTILPHPKLVVKIAAIEHRSKFATVLEAGSYFGIELGADVTADINLDDFVVYDVDQRRATEFFKNLIFRHYKVSETADPNINSADELVSTVFTQAPVFLEFVRAVEGVPRDAMNLAAMVARHAWGRQISINDVRKAAREWYQQDKMAITKSAPVLGQILNTIVTNVIEGRRARAFLFPTSINVPEIDQLYDARLLHLLKKSIASKDEAGRRYDVYKIDYGCYVDLISTTKAPLGLLAGDEGNFVDVPPDDYRSIRRAILRPEDIPNLNVSNW